MARRVVLQGVVGAVAGGNPAMRPDQQLQPTSRAGTGPAPQNLFIFARVIVISGSGVSGLFQYSGTPGFGNAPILWAAPPGVTHDPFGNPLPVNGGIASKSGTLIAQMVSGEVIFETTSFPPANPAVIGIGGAGATTQQLLLSSGNVSTDTASTLALTSGTGSTAQIAERTSQVLIVTGVAGAATTALLEVQGTTALKNAGTPSTVTGYAQPLASGGNLVYVNGVTGDANLYDTGTLHLVTSPAFTVSATAFPNAVPGVTVNVGIGHYRFRCVINCTTAAGAGAPQFEFTFPSATGVMMQTYTPTSTAGNAQSNQNNFSAATSLSLAVGPTLNTHGFICVWEGDLTTTAAGSLALNAITNTLGDNYVVATAWLDLYPVN